MLSTACMKSAFRMSRLISRLSGFFFSPSFLPFYISFSFELLRFWLLFLFMHIYVSMYACVRVPVCLCLCVGVNVYLCV